jgi:hypothetical protein
MSVLKTDVCLINVANVDARALRPDLQPTGWRKGKRDASP